MGCRGLYGVHRSSGVTGDDSIEGVLPDLSGISLGDLSDLEGLDEQLAKVMKRVDRPGTSISGYNGAGGDLEKKSTVDVELPHD